MSARAPRRREGPHPFVLTPESMYRIAYSVGGADDRRITRSIVVFKGASERRRWDGAPTTCLDFELPHGRALSLLDSQLVDARPARYDERGHLVLATEGNRRLPRRRLSPRPASA